MIKFDHITLTTSVRDSLSKLLNRDLTALTLSSGTEFPQEVDEGKLGWIVNRTDLKALYSLDSVDPVTWNLVLDYSSEIPNGDWIEEHYQPLASNLTALSKVLSTEKTIPYFLNSKEMSSLTLTDYSMELLETKSSDEIRDRLKLGKLATKDMIDGATDITRSSITEEKLTFTPIKSAEGFSTGDIKETYDTVIEEGWINFSGSIGDTGSGASYANPNCEALFKVLWNLSSFTVSPSKGTSANDDWNAKKRITFPAKAGVFATSNIRIKL